MSNEQSLRLSPSAVSEYENCPQQYKYRKIDKLPEPPSLDAERGTLVHTVLQDLFEIPAAGRTVDSALDLLPSRWSAQLAEKPALLEMVTNEKEWLDRASALVKTYFTLENPTTFDELERFISIYNQTNNLKYFFGPNYFRFFECYLCPFLNIYVTIKIKYKIILCNLVI